MVDTVQVHIFVLSTRSSNLFQLFLKVHSETFSSKPAKPWIKIFEIRGQNLDKTKLMLLKPDMRMIFFYFQKYSTIM